MVVAKTQSGKTGSMCSTIKQYLEDNSGLIPIIPVENIYIITGLSSIEWKEQTKDRMPESIQKRVFHRGQLKKFVDEIKNKKDVLIIMDEIQVAAQKEQTIYKTFKNAGLTDKQRLFENDIKILEYTATPDGTIYDWMKWKDASEMILAEVGDGYVSAYDLLQQERVKQYKDLCGYNKTTGVVDEAVLVNIREIKEEIEQRYTEPQYHFIRTKPGFEQDMTIDNFEKVFEQENYDFKKYDQESGGNEEAKEKDINTIIAIKPQKHTFIFIKEMLRCAKTLTKTHIGILYDRHTPCPDDATVIQGLVGRNTGYDNQEKSICYTNIESIEKYEELWNSQFENRAVKWNSKTTKHKNGETSGKDTFNDPKHYSGFLLDETNKPKNEEEFVVIKLNSLKEAQEYYKTVLQKIMTERGGKGFSGPRERKNKIGEFYLSNIEGNKKVRTVEEVKSNYKKIMNDKPHFYRLYPCYRDLNDKTTEEWHLIYQK